MPGRGAFDRCVAAVRASGSASSPAGVCAAAGRKKYGAQKFQQMAAAGRRRAARKNTSFNDELNSALNQLLSYSPTGTALKAIETQREKLQRKLQRENRKAKNAGRKSWRKTVKRTKTAMRRLGVSEWDQPIAEKRKYKQSRKTNRGRKNPRNPVDSAQAAYEAFHGQPSEELIDIVTPIHEHSVVAGVGELRKLVVTARDGRKVTISNFGVNQHGQKAYLSMNEARTQLFIDGGDQSVNLKDFAIREPHHETETLGKVEKVYYFTTKKHLRPEDGGTATYRHQFGGMVEVPKPGGGFARRRSEKPDLIYDVRNKLLHFSGGGYTLPDEGIDG